MGRPWFRAASRSEPGCRVKDSFAALDLAPWGFHVLFDPPGSAQHRRRPSPPRRGVVGPGDDGRRGPSRLDLVGYEAGEDLEAATAAGFLSTGPLRVWMH
jgi:hypothetical protein